MVLKFRHAHGRLEIGDFDLAISKKKQTEYLASVKEGIETMGGGGSVIANQPPTWPMVDR